MKKVQLQQCENKKKIRNCQIHHETTGRGLLQVQVNENRYQTIYYLKRRKASRNNRLVGIIYNLREQLTSFRAKSMAYPGRLEETLEEHRRIVDTIAQGDVEGAQKASEYHMERSEHTLLLSMEDKEGNME